MLLNVWNLLAFASLVTAAKGTTKWTGPRLFAGDKTSPIQDNKAPPAPQPSTVTYHHFDCGTDKDAATNGFLDTVNKLYDGSRVAASTIKRKPSATPAPISINLYMHVVSTAAHANMVNNGQMAQEYTAMNNAYKQIGVQFVLQNTSWTVNDDWAVGADSDSDTAMKTALRQGTYADLNLYFQTDLSGGILGKCNFPSAGNTDPSDYVGDGCNIAAGTVPGGSIGSYNLGMTAVHEVGHWLGLLHTFENYSCEGTGDYIDDTPAESQSTNGCPTKPPKNTCASSRKGVDPIHNYMDYSTDACYSQFTAGQGARVKSLWTLYRQGN